MEERCPAESSSLSDFMRMRIKPFLCVLSHWEFWIYWYHGIAKSILNNTFSFSYVLYFVCQLESHGILAFYVALKVLGPITHWILDSPVPDPSQGEFISSYNSHLEQHWLLNILFTLSYTSNSIYYTVNVHVGHETRLLTNISLIPN